MIVEIKNEFLAVKINTLGAEVKSIKTGDEERLHQPNEIWEDQSPVLFPICGAPKDGKITVCGKDYPMPPHGFAMFSEFELVNQTETSATFLLTSSEETKKSYPYDFEFFVTYRLTNNSLDICYKVVNKSVGKMYFSFGSHEGYIIPEGLSAYELHFEKMETEKPHIYETKKIPENSLREADGHSVLDLSDDLFEDSVTVVYKDVESDFVVLRNKETKKEIKVQYPGIENLFVWAEPNHNFVCIEPWCGLADYGEAHADISEKLGIHELFEDSSFERHHIITFC